MPSDGPNTRLLRACILAEELVERGHDVTYLNSTFNHQKKHQRYDRTTSIIESPGYRSVYLYGRSYRSNIGVRRILSHRDNAHAFRKWAKTQPMPDIIHCGLPPIELAAEASCFARLHQIPFTVDCRDVWPEIIEDRLSPLGRILGAPLIHDWRRKRSQAMTAATAITGVSDGFVQWGVASSGRPRREFDRPFHLATPATPIDKSVMDVARKYWLDLLGDFPADGIIVAYAGTFSRRFDFPTVLSGADLLSEEERSRFRIVLCGSGDVDGVISERAKMNPAIVNGGWRSRPELLALMSMSAAGLLPYPNSQDFLVTFPNKVGEYLTSGLPILTGIGGAVDTLLAPHSLKIGYTNGDPADFVAALRSLERENHMADLRHKAKKLAQEKFSPEKIYPAFADWLEMVATTGGSAR
ncbi:hypothetical protein IDJ81_02370 [Tsuneonella flava]|uniref:Glycosyltransferase subfamily 4-like N-terminal domain-containing protein n=1 Tax=Tsuneonella flava TaxID=2055955 RepID=A0ABX7KDC0_9SPHN|nr:glycosyltransferase [Tsuneonella flava]QSB45031.1 hypothetical protein IDJ81_02370 [Tsuneonella flava]